MRHIYLLSFLLFIASTLQSQNLTDVDTTLFKADSTKLLFTKFGNLNISGYLQAQYQLTQSEGAKNFSGGNFSEFSDNRFMLRRARFKIDYLYAGKKMPIVYFALQVDATERAVVPRDVYGQLIDPKYKRLSMFMGLFARPFGFETNLSSGSRAAPERGRMNQILFPRERDMGVMVNFHSLLKHEKFIDKLNISLGVFNGPGLFTTAEQDSYKDIISRIQINHINLGDDITLSGAVSSYFGAIRSNNEKIVTFKEADNNISISTDASNVGKRMVRVYYGADLQLKKKHQWGSTELRMEYIKGRQPGNQNSTFTAISESSDPVYSRPFEGAYIMFLQNIINSKHQLLLKYDYYDQNTSFEQSLAEPVAEYSEADVRYDTWGLGYCYYLNKHCKIVLYYDMIINQTLLKENSDMEDDVFTARLHFNF